MGYAIMRINKIKSISQVNARIKHNHRQFDTPFKAEIKNPTLIINQNNQLSYGDYLDREVGKVRKNAVVAIEVVTSFSYGSVSADQLQSWVGANISWVSDTFGGLKNIYDVALHLDESTPHLHFVVAPIFENKLSCFHFINGRGDLSKMQTTYASKMKKFNLDRGIERSKTNAFHQPFRDYRAKEIDRIKKIERQEREKAIKKIYGEIGITPKFREDIHER